jgi:uncharacterized protein (TIGR00369 family)
MKQEAFKMALKMTIAELSAFIEAIFPQVEGDFVIEAMEEGWLRARLRVTERHLRPGGTVSGPSMFGLVDVSAYFVTLAHIGPEALAVTTNCSIDFMRKPSASADLIADARLLKLGRNLSVTDVLLYSEGAEKPVARATLTYSLPPKST